MPSYYNEHDPQAAEWIRQLIMVGEIPPGDVDERSIEDVVPTDLAGYTQCHFFAGIAGWPYALRLAGVSADTPLWTGSCPCFPAGTLVLTKTGLVDIEDIQKGDLVWTHKQRWREVLKTGCDRKPVGVLKGQGHPGLAVTNNHPFYSRTRAIQATHRNGGHIRVHNVTEPKWSTADDMPGKWWAMPRRISALPIPEFLTPGLAWIAGMYVGDGWLGTGTRKNSIVFGLNEKKAEELIDKLNSENIQWKRYEERTGPRIVVSAPKLSAWLKEDFRCYSHLKRIPLWLLGADRTIQGAFLEGWMAADGARAETTGCRSGVTVSKQLAFGIRMLLVSLGYSVSMRLIHTLDTGVIEGRAIAQRDYYRVSFSQNTRYTIKDEHHSWFRVKSFTPGIAVQPVYNLEIQEDNSYVVEGIVVHNCQPFSTAGQGKGAADERHLWPAFHWLISQCRPERVLGEQVAGRLGETWLDLVSTDMEGEGYTFGAVVMAACSVGAPHQRKRLYWVAHSDRRKWGGRTVNDEMQSNRQDGRRLEANSEPTRDCEVGSLPNTSSTRLPTCELEKLPGPQRDVERRATEQPGSPSIRRLGHADSEHTGRDTGTSTETQGRPCVRTVSDLPEPPGPTNGFWRNAEWLPCQDGKYRSAKPGTFPLAHESASELVCSCDIGPQDVEGTTEARAMRLKGYGNAVVAEQAAHFIRGALDLTSLLSHV